MKKAVSRFFQRTIVRYSIISLLATAVDFGFFFLLGFLPRISNGLAAFFSAFAGAIVSWNGQRLWVFEQKIHAARRRRWIRFFVGTGLGVFLNGFLVFLISDLADVSRMLGRVLSALIGWFFLYWFNSKIVFKK